MARISINPSYLIPDLSGKDAFSDVRKDPHVDMPAMLIESTISLSKSLPGLFIARDPAQYIDGMNLYQMELGNAINEGDPIGLQGSTTQATTQPAPPINLPGGPGKPSSGSTSYTIPGFGTVDIYAGNNGIRSSGGDAAFSVKITPATRCKCKKLTWSQQVKITINNSNHLSEDDLDAIRDHERVEHGLNDPLDDYVPDNGYTDPILKADPTDPWAPPPGYKEPNRYAPPLPPQSWKDPKHPFLPGDVAFGDWPFIPFYHMKRHPDTPYPAGADVTKEFIVQLYCDGKAIGPQIQWSVRGVAGSGQNSTVNVSVG